MVRMGGVVASLESWLLDASLDTGLIVALERGKGWVELRQRRVGGTCGLVFGANFPHLNRAG